MSITAFPLSWPVAFDRSKSREAGRFKTTGGQPPSHPPHHRGAADEQDWRAVLGVSKSAGVEEAKAAYRKLAATHHPDKGGASAEMTRINQAWERAQRELGA